jgi:hypothetical protein
VAGRPFGLFGGGAKASPPASAPAPAPTAPPTGEIALSFVQDGQRRDITVRELAIGTKLTTDALLSLLVEKGLLTAEELQARIHQISTEHYRAGEPPAEGGAE